MRNDTHVRERQKVLGEYLRGTSLFRGAPRTFKSLLYPTQGDKIVSLNLYPVLAAGGRWGPRRARAGRRASSSSSWCLRRTRRRGRTRGHPRCAQPSRRAPFPGRTVSAPSCTWSPPAAAAWVRVISWITECVEVQGHMR